MFRPKAAERLKSIDIGDRSEQNLIVRLMAAGYNVLKPISKAARYDLVIEDAEYRFWRIQCKTGRYKNGVVEFQCYTKGQPKTINGSLFQSATRYTANEVDYFAVWCPSLNKAYLIAFSDVPEKLCKLRVDKIEYENYGPQRGRPIRWAADYEL